MISDIRDDIVGLLLSVPNLGGDDGTPANRKVHKYAYETDDVKEAQIYWATTIGGAPVFCGAMVTRENRDDAEPVAGRHFTKVHRMKVVLRYGKAADPLAEQTFEDMLDAFMDALSGSELFKRDGLHPQPFGDQVAQAESENKKLFGTRVWEAVIRFVVVEQRFQASIS